MSLSQQQRPLNILAIDGGGVRGLSALSILQKIMGQLQFSAGRDLPLFPWQIFDIICGTSTGGLIAIMLGRLRMSVDDAIYHYRDFCKTVFSSPRWFGYARRMVFGTPTYYGSTLERCIKGIVAQSDATEHDEEALMREPFSENSDGPYCKTFVVATKRHQADGSPVLFKSYAEGGSYKIWECARATTATVGYFEPIKIRMEALRVTYIDGDLAANNPSILALDEAQRLFPDQPISCFLSLGTGLGEMVKMKGNLIELGNAFQDLNKNSESVAGQVFKTFQRKPQSSYARFTVDRGLETVKFDEWDRESYLAAVTDGYMGSSDQTVSLNRCVEALKLKAEWIRAQRELQ